jgi:hypothetical protein
MTGPKEGRVTVAYGKTNVGYFNGVSVQADYDDDVCFFFGVHKLYLKRHIIRAFEEAQEKLSPLLYPRHTPE